MLSSIHPIVRFPRAKPIMPGNPSRWLPSRQTLDIPQTEVFEIRIPFLSALEKSTETKILTVYDS